MFKRFTTLLRESARRGSNPSFIHKILIDTAVKGHVLLLKNTYFFLLKVKPSQCGDFFSPCSTHWAHNQYLFLCLWGDGARAPVVQTIIIWAGSKKSHVSQFMSALVAWSDGWFRIWNKLRNHFLLRRGHSSFFFPFQAPRHLRPASCQTDVTSR